MKKGRLPTGRGFDIFVSVHARGDSRRPRRLGTDVPCEGPSSSGKVGRGGGEGGEFDTGVGCGSPRSSTGGHPTVCCFAPSPVGFS